MQWWVPVVRDVGLCFLISLRLRHRLFRCGVVLCDRQVRAEPMVRRSAPDPRRACGSGGNYKPIGALGS
jgi:hypothetical protein